VHLAPSRTACTGLAQARQAQAPLAQNLSRMARTVGFLQPAATTPVRVLRLIVKGGQVFLSIALPFSMIPLTIFTSSKKIMGEQWVNKRWVTVLAWTCTIVLTILNVQIVLTTIKDLF